MSVIIIMVVFNVQFVLSTTKVELEKIRIQLIDESNVNPGLIYDPLIKIHQDGLKSEWNKIREDSDNSILKIIESLKDTLKNRLEYYANHPEFLGFVEASFDQMISMIESTNYVISVTSSRTFGQSDRVYGTLLKNLDLIREKLFDHKKSSFSEIEKLSLQLKHYLLKCGNHQTKAVQDLYPKVFPKILDAGVEFVKHFEKIQNIEMTTMDWNEVNVI